jgi:hypothetical protein
MYLVLSVILCAVSPQASDIIADMTGVNEGCMHGSLLGNALVNVNAAVVGKTGVTERVITPW